MQNTSTKNDATKNEKNAIRAQLRAIANGEKNAVNDFFRAHAYAGASVPLKSRAKFGKSYDAKLNHRAKSMQPESSRAHSALFVVATCAGIDLHGGATFPRNAKLGGVAICTENGAGSDLIGSFVTYNDNTEKYTITAQKADALLAHIGAKQCKAIKAAIGKADFAADIAKSVKA